MAINSGRYQAERGELLHAKTKSRNDGRDVGTDGVTNEPLRSSCVFGDYLDQWNFDFNIKIDPEDDKKFTVEVTGGFDRDTREARAAIKSFREVLKREQAPGARTPQSVLDPEELLTKIDGGQESQHTSSGEFDSYRSVADSNVRIFVAMDVVPPFRFNAGGWELSQSPIDPGPAIRARIAENGFFMFRVSEDQSAGVELAGLPPRSKN
jgi:hypothetical protein